LSSKSTFSNSTSRSYAMALYELSKENSELNQTEDSIKGLQGLLKTNNDFKAIITDPTVTKESKGKIVSEIAEKNNFSKTAKNFLGFIAIKNRLFFLDKIIESFLSFLSKSKGESKVSLVSSKELSTEELKKIQDELSKNFESKLNIDYKYDPSLLGGLIIQIGSIMIDTSIKTKLKKLERNMVEA